MRWLWRRPFAVLCAMSTLGCGCSRRQRSEYDPKGAAHVVIGTPNTVDTLKTYVEGEGNFSPGFGSYGVYTWLQDGAAARIAAPTMNGIRSIRGLLTPGVLIPWVRWFSDQIEVTDEIAQTSIDVDRAMLQVAALRVKIRNHGASLRHLRLIAAIRPVGAAGADIDRLAVSRERDALIANGHPALISQIKPSGGGASSSDWIVDGSNIPTRTEAQSWRGNCSGALFFDFDLKSGEERIFDFTAPVLPGRRSAPHHWVDRHQGAMVDDAVLGRTGEQQPDPALDFYRQLGVNEIFAKSEREWRSFHSGIEWQLPDPEWNAALLAIPAHLAMAFNDGAPDVTAINYNTYTRDAAYIINVLQKAGASRLSRLGVRYLLRHPFSGRPFPEADNPGQVIWSADREEAFSGDPLFAREAMPRIRQLAILISWLRTTPVPHFVDPRTLEYGGDSKNGRRVRLEPGDCDGHHPEYTEAFDVAGLRAAADLAEAAGNSRDAAAWRSTAAMLLSNYDREFSKELENGYGRYSVLWPCHLYGLNDQKVRATFYGLGPQRMKSWRYFPLAAAHQSLLAGNRAAGAETIKSHLNSEMMSGWDVLDEGGPSASGGWQRVRTLWPRNVKEPGLNASVAEPHGWALAELWLLMRDALVFEDGSELRLLAGVPPSWFEEGEWGIGGVPVQEGRLTLQYVRRGDSGILETSLAGRSERTFVLNFAAATEATITAAGQTTRCAAGAECLVRFARGPVRVQFQERGR